MGQQWPAAGAEALGAADLGMASTLFKEVAINPTIELPELTQDWKIDSWRAQKIPCMHEDLGARGSDPQVTDRLACECPGVSGGSMG